MDQSLKIKLADQPWQACECGGLTFTEHVMFKKVSKLLTGSPDDQHVPIPVLICDKCKLVPSFISSTIPLIPTEMRAVTSQIYPMR